MAADAQEDAPDAQAIVSNRQGEVLLKGTILKSDHFPGALREPLPLESSLGRLPRG